MKDVDTVPDDEVLWEAVVSAGDNLARTQADFYQNADNRRSALLKALNGSPRHQASALEFLRSLPDDVDELLEPLFELALSHRWAGAAREVIGRSDDRIGTQMKVRELVNHWVTTADSNDFWRISELAVKLQDWTCLKDLTIIAANSDDPDVVEVATWNVAEFGWILNRPE